VFAAATSTLAMLWTATAAAGSWIFQPSSFTHDSSSGERVVQYAPKKPPIVRTDPTYRQSAYRHHRSTIRVGGSADRLHTVETWGAGASLRPYGEWQRPFREGATLYGPWGPYGLGRSLAPRWGYPPGSPYRPLPFMPDAGGLYPPGSPYRPLPFVPNAAGSLYPQGSGSAEAAGDVE
jgi:hypothetical protein